MKIIIIAQILGLFGALSSVVSGWQKNRNKMLLFLMFDNIFYTAQYILLGAYTGAVTNIIGLLRTALFKKKGQFKYLKGNCILYIILIMYIWSCILTFDGIGSYLPLFASLVYAITLWQDDVKKIRFGTMIMYMFWIIYNIMYKAYAGAVIETILFISILIVIIKRDILDKRNNREIVEEAV